MNRQIQLDRLKVASPCPTSWEHMKGDERVRFCELCSLHVYNIAELTANEAKSLVANTEGRICARLYRRSDGTVITKDCPVGLRAIRRRVARIAGAAFATIMSLCGGAFGQKAKDDKSCRQQVKITRTISDRVENGVITGTVLDPNGAIISGAGVTLIEAKSKKSREVKSDDSGRFEFSALAPGSYKLELKTTGFEKLVLKGLRIAGKETISIEATQLIDGAMVMGIIADQSFESVHGVTIINQKMIQSLPIR
jgi:Carboxypeptidase regulatory-like domain